MNLKRNWLWLQTMILIVCLALSYLSFRLVHSLAQMRSEENFAVLTDQGLTSLDRRFEEYCRTLDGVAGLFRASDQVSAAEMSTYGEALDIAEYMSGIDAIGFAARGPADLVRSTGLPTTDDTSTGASPDPSDAPDDHFTIRYIEPRASNENLLGLDFATIPNFLAIATASRDTKKTLLAMDFRPPGTQSGKPQAILLKPIFSHASEAASSGDQPAEFLGFAFATVNLNEVFSGLTAAQNQLIELDVGVKHPNDPAAPPIHNIGPTTTSTKANYVLVQDFERLGQTLILTWRSTPRFDFIQPFRARWVVLALGLLVTALVSLILNVIIRRERTVRKLVAQKSRDLETREKEQRSILENAMLAIISVNRSGEILHSNEAAQQLLAPHKSTTDLTGQTVKELLPELDLQRADGRFKLQVPSAFDDDELTIIEVEKNTWLTSDGETRLTLLLRDITASERHAQEIAKTEQRWNLALMGAQIGVFDVDLKRQTSVVSDTWRKMMQIDAPSDLDNPYRTQMGRMHPDDRAIVTEAEAACIDGRTDRAEARFRIKLPNDEWRWIQSDAVVVERSATGAALRMLGTQMDITESTKLDRMKRDFVATVSHELRTPLTSIKGALGLLGAQLEDAKPGAAERLIQIAVSNSDRLVSLVNDILDMEKINAGSMNHVSKAESLSNIMGLASEQVGPYASQWHVGLEVVMPQDERNIWTDKKRAIQVLTNLLSNACKFAHAETTVRLTAEVLPTYARISVSNLGPGIPEEFRSKIFQPFSQADSSDTRQKGGTGLGLNISRQLIEAMGGTIGFDSEPDKETVFWFTCPLADGSGNGPVV